MLVLLYDMNSYCSQALRILVKQFNESGLRLVDSVLKQLTSSPVWDHRKEASQLLQHLGRKYTCQDPEREELVYAILERRLWDDSVEVCFTAVVN